MSAEMVEMGIKIGKLVEAEHDLDKAQAVLFMMLRMKEVWTKEAKGTLVGYPNWWGLEKILTAVMKIPDHRSRAMFFRDRHFRRWLSPEERYHIRSDLRLWVSWRGRRVLDDFFTRLAEIEEKTIRDTG